MTTHQIETMIRKYRLRLEHLSAPSNYLPPSDSGFNTQQRRIALCVRLLAEYKTRLRQHTT